MNAITLKTLAAKKAHGEKFACLTAYDASFAHLISKAGIEVLLIGDSLGQVIQGHTTTVPVMLEEVSYHTRCVARGNAGSLLIADLPFMSYASKEHAITSSAMLMQAGAHMVKLEGGKWTCEIVHHLAERGIAVCSHIGLTPQSVHAISGYSVQGKEAHKAQQLIEDALALQEAGARLIVLECIPQHLAAEITERLTIPTIGIGAGPYCDGQILVLYDLLGISRGEIPRLAKNFLAAQLGDINAAISAYHRAVKEQTFPGPENIYV